MIRKTKLSTDTTPAKERLFLVLVGLASIADGLVLVLTFGRYTASMERQLLIGEYKLYQWFYPEK